MEIAAATTSGETSGEASLGTTTVDPSLGTSGFQTSGFDDCEKALQATIRDFKTDHPELAEQYEFTKPGSRRFVLSLASENPQ